MPAKHDINDVNDRLLTEVDALRDNVLALEYLADALEEQFASVERRDQGDIEGLARALIWTARQCRGRHRSIEGIQDELDACRIGLVRAVASG